MLIIKCWDLKRNFFLVFRIFYVFFIFLGELHNVEVVLPLNFVSFILIYFSSNLIDFLFVFVFNYLNVFLRFFSDLLVGN